jgi:hypothetical protein
MSWSLRSSYLSLKVWGHHIYILKFEVVIFMFQRLRWTYLCLEAWDDLKLQDIYMMTSSCKTYISRPQTSRHKYDDLKLASINMKVWGCHIYVSKIEVDIFMSWSLRSSYLCLEVWGRHIYDWKFEVIIFMSRHKYDDLKHEDKI